tara:strand:+ start:1747 stop:2289 length:543 start_codon:yes stop_codon:yes gene_type:complete
MNTAIVRPVADEINQFHEEARQHAVATRRSLHAALTAAWRAGQLLVEEKKRVRRAMGAGSWLIWLEQNFHGTPRTAQRYMRLAQNVTDVAFLQGMSLRQAYDRLDIPMETKSPSRTFPLPGLSPYVTLANKLVRALPTERELLKLPSMRAAAVRQDLAPLYRRMCPLFEGTSTRSANLCE